MQFPDKGLPEGELSHLIEGLVARDPAELPGAFNIWWPIQPPHVRSAAVSAFSRFAHYNTFMTSTLGSLKTIDAELRAFIADILRAPQNAHVTLTTGGTESNYLASKSARDRLRARRPETARKRLNIVIPATAHPSFDKNAQMMDMDVVRVPVTADWRADVSALAEAIDDETCLLVASAPSYSHGVVDPVAEIARLAHGKGIWMHVDACVGGFLHPFLRENGKQIPEFDFTIAGVDSISADLHKFGLCINGISSFTLRDEENLKYQSYLAENIWPTGNYYRAGFSGTRPGATVVAAWAVFRTLGRDGFRQMAERIDRASDQLARGLAKIDGLTLNALPECGVVSVKVDNPNLLNSLINGLNARNFYPGKSAHPPSLHFLAEPIDNQDFIDAYIRATAEVMQEIGATAPITASKVTVAYGE